MQDVGRRRGVLLLAAGSVAIAVGLAVAMVGRASAHCDTMSGPVVRDAQLALEDGKVDRVLKWVAASEEAEIRHAFSRALAVRGTSASARELADQWFFETLVRLHRAGEGEPYTGLKSADTPVDPVVEAADGALEHGNVDSVINALTAEVEKGIRSRFERAIEARRHADDSTEAGRAYVEAYVDYVHFLEQLHLLVSGQGPAHEPAGVHGAHAEGPAH